MGFLAEKYELPILIDTKAFKTDPIDEVVVHPVRLPKLVNVRLRLVLDELVDQIPGAVVQEGNLLRVVPKEQAIERLLGQRVELIFDQIPLADALRKLEAETGFNVILDRERAGDKARTAISASLRHLRLADAVRIVADLAELEAVELDMVLFVTTPEHAAELRRERFLRKIKLR